MLSALSVSMSKYQTWKTHIHVDDRAAVLIFLLMAATSLVWHDLDIPLLLFFLPTHLTNYSSETDESIVERGVLPASLCT